MNGEQDGRAKFVLKVSDDDDDVAYLRLPAHVGPGTRMSRSIRLRDVLGEYQGPDVILDFDEANVLAGIELLN